jgi:hypothetical protein
MGNASVEIAKLIVSTLALAGTFLAAGIALRSFLRGEHWKRAEFLAREMKEFFDGSRVQNALLLIDWGTRRIQLLDDNADDHGRVKVTRQLQVRALLPHTLLSGAVSDPEQVGDADSSMRRYTPAEAAIRDCYDAFLDGLERFSSYTQTGLISVKQLRPYLQYWIDDVHTQATDEEDAAWSAALLTYIAFYRFHGVQWLFRAFDRSIDPSGSTFVGFLTTMRDQQLAERLAAAAGAKYTVRVGQGNTHAKASGTSNA